MSDVDWLVGSVVPILESFGLGLVRTSREGLGVAFSGLPNGGSL
jgi:hypothetical protein